MLEEVKKSLMAGFGAVILTRKKVEEITKKLVDDAKLTQEDAKRLKEELIDTGQQQWEEAEKFFSEAIKKGIAAMHLASRSEVNKLSAKFEGMERRISSLEKENTAKRKQ